MARKSTIYKGQIFSTKSGDCEVIRYQDSAHVKIRFLETGYKVWSEAGNLRKGLVKDPLVPSVFGVGYPGAGKYEYKKHPLLYSLWKSMLELLALFWLAINLTKLSVKLSSCFLNSLCI